MESSTRGGTDMAGLLVGPEAEIGTVLKLMDESGRRIMFIVDAASRLLGVATDGDIRRWIIDGKSLHGAIADAMNHEPIVVREVDSRERAKELMIARKVDCVPVVSDAGTIVSAVWWVDLFDGEIEIEREQLGVPVVIMAGGEGARLAPYTRVLPKPLIPVGDVPIVELIIEKFVAYGCRDVYLSVNYKANLIKAYFRDVTCDYDVKFVDEPKPLGTAGSLSILAGEITTSFFVSNCDVIIDADYADVMRFHRESGNRLTIVGSLKHFTIPYGVCETTVGGQLVGITEKPEFDHLVSTGMYVMEPGVLDDIPRDRFYHMTDLLSDYIARGVKVGVYPVSEKSWMDMGRFEELADMRTRMGLQ
ncbi:MAG TPA: nucleotidyltransferase family protein [Coriobacteriia bacterium]